jgi:hypothetical protein
MIRHLIHKLMMALTCRHLVCISNIAEGVHGDGCIDKQADAVQALRYVLVKIGSDIGHVAVTTANTEIPLGVCNDEVAAIGDNVNVQLLGVKQGTILVRAEAAITAGDYVVAAESGRVQTIVGLSTVTTYIVGRALNAAVNQDDLVEIQHCVPVQRVIA